VTGAENYLLTYLFIYYMHMMHFWQPFDT